MVVKNKAVFGGYVVVKIKQFLVVMWWLKIKPFLVVMWWLK